MRPQFELEKGMKGGDVVLFKEKSEEGFNFYPGDVYADSTKSHLLR
jgi:hypothetical protein